MGNAICGLSSIVGDFVSMIKFDLTNASEMPRKASSADRYIWSASRESFLYDDKVVLN